MKQYVAVLALAWAACGCAEIKLARSRPDLDRALRAGQIEEAARAEARTLALIDEAHGPDSVDAARARKSVALRYAEWKRMDKALALAEETVERLDPAAPNQAIVPALLGLALVQLLAKQWSEVEATTDRVVRICNAAPPHVATAADPYDECHFARYDIDDYFLESGAYEKFARAYVSSDEANGDPADRRGGISKLTVLGRGYARFGAYPEAVWYLQRCVDESRPRYDAGEHPPPIRKVAATASGDVEVLTLDSAHSFQSQSPRCLEDLIRLRRIAGDEKEAAALEAWQHELWRRGPDLERGLVDRMRKSDEIWHDGFNTSADANNLAFYYAGKGRIQDAIRLYREALRLIDDQLTKDGPFDRVYPVGLLMDELHGLASACESVNMASDAVAAYARATAVVIRELHPRDERQLTSRAGLARSLAAAGRRDEAETAWREYLETARAIRGEDHLDFATGLEGLASTLSGGTGSRNLRARAATIRTRARGRIDAALNLPLPVALRSPALTGALGSGHNGRQP